MIETKSITRKSMHTNMRLQRLSLGINPVNMKIGQNFVRNCSIPTTNNYRNLTFCNKYLTTMLKNHATFGFATQPVKLALRAATAIEFKFT